MLTYKETNAREQSIFDVTAYAGPASSEGREDEIQAALIQHRDLRQLCHRPERQRARKRGVLNDSGRPPLFMWS